jgi:hypothetical protein
MVKRLVLASYLIIVLLGCGRTAPNSSTLAELNALSWEITQLRDSIAELQSTIDHQAASDEAWSAVSTGASTELDKLLLSNSISEIEQSLSSLRSSMDEVATDVGLLRREMRRDRATPDFEVSLPGLR